MSLFKKRKNLNIRQRRLDEDEEENLENCSENNISVQNNATEKIKVDTVEPLLYGDVLSEISKDKKKKTKPKTEKKVNVLSFEDELEADDGIVFQEKKSSLSYKLRKEVKKEKREKKREEKDRLRQTLGKNSKSKEKSPNTLADLNDLGIRIVNGREAEATTQIDSDLSDDADNNVAFEKSQQKQSLRPWKAALQSGVIPDATTIHEIRKERQKAARQAPVFIPIDDTIRSDATSGRLIREDDNDRSDGERDGNGDDSDLDSPTSTAVLRGSAGEEARRKRDRRKRRQAIERAQLEESDHDWEMQQLLKAAPATAIKLSGGLLPPESSFVDVRASAAPFLPSVGVESSVLLAGSVAEAPAAPLNYKADGIIKRLKESRDSMQEALRGHRTSADSVIDELLSANSTAASCKASVGELSAVFRFYQDMRGYVLDLRHCLNEKVSEISRLENQVYAVYRQKSQALVQRRRQDIKDQNNEFSPFAGKQAKGDEFRIRRAAEREGRRTRRRKERERGGGASSSEADLHRDGMSTDDEEATQVKQHMEAELEVIRTASLLVFEDVHDDFASLTTVASRFSAWKRQYRDHYVDAYVTNNLPKLFAPFIRLDLLLWNPLCKEGDCGSSEIERRLWFSQLLRLDVGNVEGDDAMTIVSFKDDPDRRVVAEVIHKVVLIKLTELVACWWDPVSHWQSVRLANLVRHLINTFPSGSGGPSAALRTLTGAIIDKMKEAIDNDIFIPMFPKSTYESKTSGVSLFFQRQFWSCWKLLGTALMWHGFLSESMMHDVAVRAILNLYLLPALALAADISVADALQKARHIVKVLPGEWCKSVEGGKPHPFLCRFEAFMTSLCSRLDTTAQTSEIRDLTLILKAVGARNASHQISHKYL